MKLTRFIFSRRFEVIVTPLSSDKYLQVLECKYLSLDNGVTMTSKRRENINLVSFICLSFLVISFSKQLHILFNMQNEFANISQWHDSFHIV